MKLTVKYTRVSMLITIAVFMVGGLAYYIVMSYITDVLLDRDLTEEFAERSAFIQQHQRLPKPFEFDTYQTQFDSIGERTLPTVFIDTLFRGAKGLTINGRAIVGTLSLNHTNYRVAIAETKDETNELMQLILLITFSLITVLFLALFLANRFLLRKLWQPFYALVTKLTSFSLNEEYSNEKQKIDIDEFNTLQTAIDAMAQKSVEEYQSLKIFTENASHEMMTPIAVITSKLDSLIQDEMLTEAQLQKLQVIYNAGDRLARLNQSLLLLVKIDNQLIKDNTVIDLANLITEKLTQMQEIIDDERIETHAELETKNLLASPYLIDILLNNLLVNAVRHNFAGGSISIILNQNYLTIFNTGNPERLDEAKIFERFEKSPASDGTGLGLTIARNICKGYGFNLIYAFQEPNVHLFTVTF